MDLHLFPTINASLNGTAGICLFMGWRAIKAGKKGLHRKWMIAAISASTLF